MIWNPITNIQKGRSNFAVPLTVYTEPGALVEAYTADGNMVSKTAPENGVAVLTLNQPGRWVARATSEGITLPAKSVEIPTGYDLSFDFHEPRLPSPYLEVAYIANPNLAYMAPFGMVLPRDGYKVEISAELANLTDSGYLFGSAYSYRNVPYSDGSGVVVRGAGQGVGFTPQLGLFVTTGADTSAWESSERYPSAASSYTKVFPLTDTTINVTVDWVNNAAICNGVEQESEYIAGTGSGSLPASYLFARHRKFQWKLNYNSSFQNGDYGDQALNFKLFSLKIYDSGNELIRDFVPCKNSRDNSVGVYDMVSGAYTTTAGDPFEAGPEV